MAHKQNEITIIHSVVIIFFSQLVHWEHPAKAGKAHRTPTARSLIPYCLTRKVAIHAVSLDKDLLVNTDRGNSPSVRVRHVVDIRKRNKQESY